MAYFYPFGITNRALSSSFADVSVSASFSASINTRAVTSSVATNIKYNYNTNLDPQWQEGDSAPDGNGWEFFQTRVLTQNIQTFDANVTKPLPDSIEGATLYSAKIATRTGTFWKDNASYKLPVSQGETYTLSTWVWCNNTLQNFPNANIAACGVIATVLDGAENVVGNEQTTITNTNNWQKVSHTFTVGAGTSSMIFGPFMDVPYPNGYGYSPECDGAYYQNPLACPGYGWFTGFTVVRGTWNSQGPKGSNVSTVCPSGYIACPDLSLSGYDLVCLEIGPGCSPGELLECPTVVPSPSTTTTSTTSTTTSTTTAAPTTTTTTTTAAPTTTTTTTTAAPTTTTTTSTSTTSTTTTTTAAAPASYTYLGKTTIDDTSATNACNNYLTVASRYSIRATLGAIIVGDIIYTDSGLTTPVNGGNNWIALAAPSDTLTRVAFRIDASGVVQEVSACVATTSTTTTTTAAACVFQYDVTGPFLNAAAACASPDAADFSVSTNNGGVTYYGDVGCNTVMATGFYKVDGTSTWVEFSTGTLVNGPTACTTTTTSTTTTGAPGTCYTAVAGGGTSNTVYWTDPTLGPQTTTISGGNKINICSNTVPYESPAADVLFYDCGTSCTTAGTCTDCEGATTTTTTSTSTTTTSTTSTTTTTIPPGEFLSVSEAAPTVSDATCLTPNDYPNGFITTDLTATLVNGVGTPITNTGGSNITVTVRYDTYYNNGCGSPSTTTYAPVINNGNSSGTITSIVLQNYSECGSGCNTEGVESPCIQTITSGSGTGPYTIYGGSSISACP